MNYPVYPIDPSMGIEGSIEQRARTGYLRKFWIEHPQLGRSLIKLEEDTAPAWSEKVSYEIATRIKLPAASYEIGRLVGWSDYADNTKVIISPDFKRGDTRYIQGEELLAFQTLPGGSYTVARVLETLTQNEVQLPIDYQAPNGIEDGADLFVGYLLLDSLTANNDRHSGNWEIGLDNRGIKTLAPIYDNGASFATTFGSIVYGNYTVEQYMNRDLSMFGEFQIETFRQAAQIRPSAATVWLSQLALIQSQEFEGILADIPRDRIEPEAQGFARKLLDYNRGQLLSLRSQLNLSSQDLTSLYQRYARDSRTTGLAKAKGIAKSALSEGLMPEQVARMLVDNNAAYKDLVARGDAVQARRMIVRKAEMELAVSKDASPTNEQSKSFRRSSSS